MSPAGLGTVKQIADEQKERQKSYGGGGKLFVKFPDSAEVIIRPLEDSVDVKWAYFHEMAKPPGRQYGDKKACLDKDSDGSVACPGCEEGAKRMIQCFANVIWRNAPIAKRDKDKKIMRDTATGDVIIERYADAVGVWRFSQTVGGMLEGKDRRFKGITSRDWVVVRTGSGFDTEYSVEPADPDGGPQPLNAADRELVKSKPDLSEMIRPPGYPEMQRLLKVPGGGGGGGGEEQRQEHDSSSQGAESARSKVDFERATTRKSPWAAAS